MNVRQSSMASALSRKQDYKYIAEKYSEKNEIQIKLGQQFVAKLDLRHGQKVLDMGCGTGELTSHIASRVGCDNVFGVDPDPKRLEIATQNASNISFTVGNSGSSFPHSNEEFYDVYFSNLVFHWLNSEEKQEYFQRAVKCLKCYGKLAIHAVQEWPKPIATLLDMAVAVDAMKPCIAFVGKATVDPLFKEFGFEILFSENLSHECKFPSLEFFITWTCATFYIDESKFSSHVKKECLKKFADEDGTVNFIQKAYQIVGRKVKMN